MILIGTISNGEVGVLPGPQEGNIAGITPKMGLIGHDSFADGWEFANDLIQDYRKNVSVRNIIVENVVGAHETLIGMITYLPRLERYLDERWAAICAKTACEGEDESLP